MGKTMKVVVVGASAAGCFASLLLARAGHEVLVLEKDRLELEPDAEAAAASAFRSSAAHIVQPHLIMARCRQLLIEHLPDVHEALIRAGVVEAPISTQMSPTLADTTPQPGDEQLTLLMSLRSTIDWVLRRAIVEQRGVTLRPGVAVTGLLACSGKPPHITGVRTTEGDVSADFVLDTSGGRSPIDHWLKAIEAQPTATLWAECGVAYFSRHYRIREGATLPAPSTTRVVIPLDEFMVGIWGADNNTMLLALLPLALDHRFKTVRYPDVFTAVLRLLPMYANWLDVLDPITDVYPMGAVHNTMRRLVNDDVPVATGMAAIGDAVCTTNPTLGRGLSFALSGAVDLLRTLHEHRNDWTLQALAMDARVAEHIVPFYEDQAAVDSTRLAMLHHAIFGAPAPEQPSLTVARVTYGQLRTAALYDPTAFRAFWRIMGMIRRPEEEYTDPQIVARTQETLREHGSEPQIVQPSREQLLAALYTRAA
jgi:2-polyprenyl-6-methoxyphenol hydroxylase-like FAD-dependent oxidoreductase